MARARRVEESSGIAAGAHGLLLLALIGAATCPLPALAQSATREPGWAERMDPERVRGRELLRQGVGYLLASRDRSRRELAEIEEDPQVQRERALVRLLRARRYLPDDPDVVFLTARTYEDWERRGEDGEPDRRTAEAIATYETLRRDHPQYHPDAVAERLGLLRARLGEHEMSIAELRLARQILRPDVAPEGFVQTQRERELAAFFRASGEPYLLSNLCEQQMLAAQLEEAERSCRAALSGSASSVHTAMTRWTLALVLERSSRHAEALREAAAAIEVDPFSGARGFDELRAQHGPLWIFYVPGLVIFEPRAEIHAYEALGHEAMAASAETADARALYLEAAGRDLRDFVRSSGDARWRQIATERARALGAAHPDR